MFFTNRSGNRYMSIFFLLMLMLIPVINNATTKEKAILVLVKVGIFHVISFIGLNGLEGVNSEL